jgi:acyl-CoA hydrolase
MKDKPVAASATVMPQRMFPPDANPAGNVHGGVILRYIDLAAATAATRHCRTPVVTASIDRMDFLAPVHVGELVTFSASVNRVGRSSLEVGVRAEAEDLVTGEVRHVASAYLTFVAMGPEARPAAAPGLEITGPKEERRHREATERARARRQERARERESQAGS